MTETRAHSSSPNYQDEPLVLMIAGDTNLQDRAEPAGAFARILPTLREADLLVGHLEGPLSAPSADPAQPDVPHKALWRHSEPRMVEGLRAANFAALSCASNVTYPPRAALDTLAVLEEAGIGHAGIGRNSEEARRGTVVACRGVKVGLLSYSSVFWPVGHAAGDDSPGIATIRAHTAYQPDRRALEMPGAPPRVVTFCDDEELTAMTEDVRRLHAQADLVLLSCHWGVSSSTEVMAYQREIARAAIEAGVDLVFGHHPHVIQEIEVYRGKPIFYSLGNFAFDWPKMRGRNLDGLLLRCLIQGGFLREVAILPVRRDKDNLIAPLDPNEPESQALITGVVERSQALGTEVYMDGRQLYVHGVGQAS